MLDEKVLGFYAKHKQDGHEWNSCFLQDVPIDSGYFLKENDEIQHFSIKENGKLELQKNKKIIDLADILNKGKTIQLYSDKLDVLDPQEKVIIKYRPISDDYKAGLLKVMKEI